MVSSWRTDHDGWRVCPLCRERVAAPAPPQVAPRTLHVHGAAASSDAKRAVLYALARAAGKRGGKRAGWVAWRYRDRFGEWPPYGAAAKALRELGIDEVGPPVVRAEPANDEGAGHDEHEAAVVDALNCG
jgi:hypothetical protein